MLLLLGRSPYLVETYQLDRLSYDLTIQDAESLSLQTFRNKL